MATLLYPFPSVRTSILLFPSILATDCVEMKSPVEAFKEAKAALVGERQELAKVK